MFKNGIPRGISKNYEPKQRLINMKWVVMKSLKVTNVFDEMYYAEVQSLPKLYTSTSYSGLIKAKVFAYLPRNVRNFFPDFKEEFYEKDALNIDEKISLNFYQEDQDKILKS